MLLSTCSAFWLPILGSVSAAAVGLLATTGVSVVRRHRTTSEDGRSTSSVTKRYSVGPSSPPEPRGSASDAQARRRS